MSGLGHVLATGAEHLILAYFLLINSFYFLFNMLSLAGILRYRRLVAFVRFGEIFRMPIVRPVSVIVPACNEEAGIIESVRSLLALRYPVFEVVVVNDGSTDATLARLVEAFGLQPSRTVFRRVLATKPPRGIYRSALHPRLTVVDKANGGKADALNAGLNVSRYPLFCAVDSDSVLERDALLKVVRPFLEDPERTIGAGGVIRLSNGCAVRDGQVARVGIPRNWIARFQVLEYLRAFLGGRLGMSLLRSTLIVSGAFGIFRKDIALACGFPDYESFSRAFRRRFGQPPKTVRLYRHPPGGGQSRLIPSRRGHEIPLDVLEPVSLTREAHHLTGLAFFADTGTPSFHALWARFMAVQNRVTGRTGDGDYRQFTSWGEDPRLDGLAVLCALETEPTVSQEPLFTNRPVPAARYLRFVHVGDIATIARTYQAIYGLWFAEHDIRPLPGWEFQCYRNKGAITDIYIPLELL